MTDRDDRIFAIEGRLNALEVTLATISTQLQGMHKIGSLIVVLAGAALGIDVFPMIGGV